jgi:hypothetical protein
MLSLREYDRPCHFEDGRGKTYQEYAGCLRIGEQLFFGRSLGEQFVKRQFSRSYQMAMNEFPITVFNHIKREFLNAHT